MARDYIIVQTDNFGMAGEMPGRDEKFLLWGMPKERCEQIVKILNEDSDERGPYYYKVKEVGYSLQIWEP